MNAPTKHKHADLPSHIANVLPGGKYHDIALQWRDTGGTLQYKHISVAATCGEPHKWLDDWQPYTLPLSDCDFQCYAIEWRVKPQPALKRVDMSRLPVGAMVTHPCTGIAPCQVIRHFGSNRSRIEGEDAGSNVVDSSAMRILPSGWIGNPEGLDACPVPEGLRYEVKLAGGDVVEGDRALNIWTHKPSSLLHGRMSYIIFYRILGLADGWTDEPEAA